LRRLVTPSARFSTITQGDEISVFRRFVDSSIDMRDQTITMNTPSEKKEVRRTLAFRRWHESLKDHVARAIVAARVERVQMGLYGDVKPVGEGVSELRINHGPGLRVYFTETLDNSIILLLVGGDKGSQKNDISNARDMLAALKQQRDARHTATATATANRR
jgi:putative addiction module killer protein